MLADGQDREEAGHDTPHVAVDLVIIVWVADIGATRALGGAEAMAFSYDRMPVAISHATSGRNVQGPTALNVSH
jgi:hypothetical protein